MRAVAWGLVMSLGMQVDAQAARAPVLLVVTPGLDADAFDAWAHRLHKARHPVTPLSLPCEAASGAQLVERIVQAGAELPEGYVVAAHGLGASLVLMAAPELEAERLVLLGPVLDVQAVGVLDWLADLELSETVDLAGELSWNGRAVAPLLLGADPPPLTCISAGLAAEVQGWIRAGAVPLPLETVEMPTWIGVSLGDDVASVEWTVPGSRALPDRSLVRLGYTRFDPQDYEHGELLTRPVPLRVATRAVRAPWGERRITR